MERDGGCLNWYHRQLKEAAERRYADVKAKCHYVMGVYFSNVDMPVGIRVERDIRDQPLIRGGLEVWDADAVVNKRRCVEGMYHCVEAGGDLTDVCVDQLCDIESICAHAKSGVGPDLVRFITRVCTEIGAVGAYDRMTSRQKRVYSYMRWLRQDMSRIATLDPVMWTGASAGHQPLKSKVREDWKRLYFEKSHSSQGAFGRGTQQEPGNGTGLNGFRKKWIPSLVLGGYENFDTCLSKLMVSSTLIFLLDV